MPFPTSEPVRSGRYSAVRVQRPEQPDVYFAKDRSGRPVTVQELIPGMPEATKLLRRFEQALAVRQAVNHPNLLALYAIERDDQTNEAYLVSEYANGGPLDTYLLAHGVMAEAQALRIVLDICAALTALADHSQVHGDLRPANIMVKVHVSGEVIGVRLAGLGVDNSAHLPTAIPYLAPEQAGRHGHPDARGDVFSMGAILWEMLTRTRFKESVSLGRPSDLRALRPDVSPTLAAIISRATAILPETRYPTVQALAEDLRALVEGRPISSSDHLQKTVRISSQGAPPPRVATPVRVVALVAVALVLVTGLIFSSGILRSQADPLTAQLGSSNQAQSPIPLEATPSVSPRETEPAASTITAPAPAGSPTLPIAAPTLTQSPATTAEAPLGGAPTVDAIAAVGEPLGNDDLEVMVESVEFTPAEDRTDGAVFYTLKLVNKTSQAMTIRFSLRDISAIDSNGTTYIDYLVKRQAAIKARCILEVFGKVKYEEAINRELTIAPNDAITFNDRGGYLYLAKADGCRPKSRVDLDVDYVDLLVAKIGYRTSDYAELTNLRWRLARP